MDEDLIAAHRDLPQLMPQLHLPVQSGSDRVLAAMNRRHTRADYLDIVERLRDARPDLALTSDFIVGFPGETEDDFAATLSLIGEVGFSGAYSFKYSPRPGTPGADMGDQVAEDIKIGAPRNACKTPSTAARRRSIAAASAAPSMCCSSAKAAVPGNSSAARLIFSRCRSQRRHR